MHNAKNQHFIDWGSKLKTASWWSCIIRKVPLNSPRIVILCTKLPDIIVKHSRMHIEATSWGQLRELKPCYSCKIMYIMVLRKFIVNVTKQSILTCIRQRGPQQTLERFFIQSLDVWRVVDEQAALDHEVREVIVTCECFGRFRIDVQVVMNWKYIKVIKNKQHLRLRTLK